MVYFKKVCGFKIILLGIAMVIFLDGIVYANSLFKNSYLRIPLSVTYPSFKGRNREVTDLKEQDAFVHDKTVDELGRFLNPMAINRLVEIADHKIVVFCIARVNEEILYAAKPFTKEIKDPHRDINVVSGDGKIKVPFEACFRGTLVNRIDLKRGFLRLDPPITDEGIDLYCESKGITKGQFKNALADDFKAILEKIGEITNKNKRLILLDSLRDIYREQEGIEMPKNITLYQALKLMRGEKVKLEANLQKGSFSPITFTIAAVKRKVLVGNPEGIHTSLSIDIEEKARKFLDTAIGIRNDGKLANAKVSQELISLDVGYGQEIEIFADGPHAKEAVKTLVGLLEGPRDMVKRQKIDRTTDILKTAGLPKELMDLEMNFQKSYQAREGFALFIIGVDNGKIVLKSAPGTIADYPSLGSIWGSEEATRLVDTHFGSHYIDYIKYYYTEPRGLQLNKLTSKYLRGKLLSTIEAPRPYVELSCPNSPEEFLKRKLGKEELESQDEKLFYNLLKKEIDEVSQFLGSFKIRIILNDELKQLLNGKDVRVWKNFILRQAGRDNI